MATASAWRDTAEALGSRIRTLREAAGLTQTTLAGMAAMERAHLSRIEAGIYGEQGPGVGTLTRLADALGVTLSSFFPE